MKPSSKHLLSRTALALLTLLGGAPSASLSAMAGVSERPGRPAQLGNDGVGGIEKTGGVGPAGSGPGGKVGPGGTGGFLPGGPVGSTSSASPSAWHDLGEALGTTAVLPTLEGSGTGEAGTLVVLSLSDARPGAVAALVIGISTLNAPFKGGTLVPTPMLIIPGLPVNGAGTLDLPALLPASVPSGLSLCMQMWMTDTSAAKGFAASNALELLVP